MLKDYLYNPDGLNVGIFNAINSYHNVWSDLLMRAVTNLGDSKLFPIYLLLFVIGRSSLPHFRTSAENHKTIYSIFLLLAGYEFYVNISPLLKEYFHFPRPYRAFPKTVHMPFPTPYVNDDYHSFPSGHAMFSMVMLCGLWPVLNKLGKYLVVLAVLGVGYSRIALAMHFPADVIAGYIISLAFMFTILVAFKLAGKIYSE